MNTKELKKEASQLKDKISRLEDELNNLKAAKDEIQNKLDFKNNIKKNYKLNDVPDRIEYDYQKIVEEMINYLKDINDYEKILEYLGFLMNRYSTNYGADPIKLYNCPECGASNVLYVGDYGFDEYDRKYAVTCGHCDFIGPESNDYGEVWVNFKDWLYKKGYLK